MSRSCPYVPGLDCGGEVLLVGTDVTEFKKGDRVFSCGSVSGTYATHGVFTADQLFRLPEYFTFKDGACIGTGYFTSLQYLLRMLLISSALQCAHAIGNSCIFVHGGSGGVGSSLLKILLSMREVKSECKNMKIIASCSRSDAERKLKEMGVDIVVDRTQSNYMDQVHNVNDGKGPDVIFEMLANINLPKDLVPHRSNCNKQEVLNKGGEVIVIGDRGPVTINPRVMMEKGTSVKGVMLFNQTVFMFSLFHEQAQQRQEALNLFYELADAYHSMMRPLISYEYSLKDADKAHIEVINHKRAGCGRIIIIPDLLCVCEQSTILLYSN